MILDADGTLGSIANVTLVGFNGTAWLDEISVGTIAGYVTVPNITRVLTLRDISTGEISINWSGSLLMERIKLSEKVDIVISVDLTMRAIETYDGVINVSGLRQRFNATSGPIPRWTIDSSFFSNSRFILFMTFEEDLIEDANQPSVLSIHDTDFHSVLWTASARDVELRNVTEEFVRHAILAETVVISDSSLSGSRFACIFDVEICAYDDVSSKWGYENQAMTTNIIAARSAINATNVTFEGGLLDRPPMFLNLWGIDDFAPLNQPIYTFENVTVIGHYDQVICPPYDLSVPDNQNGLTCVRCPTGQMPGYRGQCVPCDGPCEVLRCVQGAAWIDGKCTKCESSLVFNGSYCDCPAGTVQVVSEPAANKGILVCAPESCGGGVMILSAFCLDIAGGVALGIVAVVVGVVVAVISILCAKARAKKRGEYVALASHENE